MIKHIIKGLRTFVRSLLPKIRKRRYMEQNNMEPHAHYLIDLENTGCRWANIIPDLKPQDTITVFFSDATGRLENDALCAAYKKGASFRFLSCANGKANAMDFQIMAELGRLSIQAPQDLYYMVTLDRGFESVEGYLADLGVSAIRLDPCSIPSTACTAPCAYAGAILKPKPSDASQPDEPKEDAATRRDYVTKLMAAGVTGAEDLRIAAGIIYAAMLEPANKRKKSVMNRFQSRYGIKEGTERYKQVRDLVFDIAEHGPFPPEGGLKAHQEAAAEKAAPMTVPEPGPVARKWPAISATSVNTILSQSGICMLKGYVAKTMECIEDARRTPEPKKTLRKLMLDYLTQPQVDKALPKLALKYL